MIQNQLLSQTTKLQRYMDKHPEYDHSVTDLTKYGKQTIQVICSEHGLFETTPNSHLQSKHTCPTCKSLYLESRKHAYYNNTKSTRLKWIAEHQAVNVDCILDDDLAIWITCKEHGHIRVINRSDKLPTHTITCSLCAKLTSFKFAQEVLQNTHFLAEKHAFPLVSSQNYLLTYTDVTNSKPMLVNGTCRVHGAFTQPFLELYNHNVTCPYCDVDTQMTQKEAMELLVNTHHSNFVYIDLPESILSSTKLHIQCKQHKHFFTTSFGQHLHSPTGGCIFCASTKHLNSIPYKLKYKPGILYFLSINDGEAYKLGITSLTVEQRYKTDKHIKSYSILFTESFDNYIDAFITEQQLLEQFIEYKYIGPALLSAGNTELLTTDLTEQLILYFTS